MDANDINDQQEGSGEKTLNGWEPRCENTPLSVVERYREWSSLFRCNAKWVARTVASINRVSLKYDVPLICATLLNGSRCIWISPFCFPLSYYYFTRSDFVSLRGKLEKGTLEEIRILVPLLLSAIWNSLKSIRFYVRWLGNLEDFRDSMFAPRIFNVKSVLQLE